MKYCCKKLNEAHKQTALCIDYQRDLYFIPVRKVDNDGKDCARCFHLTYCPFCGKKLEGRNNEKY